MKRNKKRLVAAVLAICALAAGGAAFTASVSGLTTPTVAGYGTADVHGATVTDIHYKLNTDSTQIIEVDLIFSDDLRPSAGHYTVSAGFDNNGAPQTCAIGSYTAGTGTSVTCQGFSEPTDTSAKLNVAVSQ
jgi:hypothetical protein